jgi:RNA polymerase sigma-70 factor (ECF subfamily)
MSRFPMPVATRATLLVKLKDREDQKSWQEFYDTYWRMIYGLAIRSGLPDGEAQDILQETVLKVVEKIPRFNYDPKIGSFKVWLLTIARSRVIDALRRLGREKARLAPLADDGTEIPLVERVPDPDSIDFDAVWEQEWREGLYEAAIDLIKKRVQPRQFQLFDCYVRKEWPPEKVAQVMGVTVNQVYLARNRISNMLRQQVRRLEARHQG